MPKSFSSPARSFSMAAASPKPLIMMLQPASASARAVARPIPEVEPVTSAVLPFSMAVLVRCGRQMACLGGAEASRNLPLFLLQCNIYQDAAGHLFATRAL